jgi:hypothetical protein
VQSHSVDHDRVSRRVLTRSMLSLATLAVAAVSVAVMSKPVQAQTYDPRFPVCMTLYNGPFGGEWKDCSFTSLPQCHATASGRAAMCEVNPYFVAPQGAPPRSHRRYRHAG